MRKSYLKESCRLHKDTVLDIETALCNINKDGLLFNPEAGTTDMEECAG